MSVVFSAAARLSLAVCSLRFSILDQHRVFSEPLTDPPARVQSRVAPATMRLKFETFLSFHTVLFHPF
jgi:hypothetical protein